MCKFKITRNPHDFGEYFDVEAIYDNEEGTKWAFNVEANTPEYWDEIAKQELKARKKTDE
jgi:hypothetical protein